MNAQGHRIVFLYSELAGYFLACAEALGQHSDVDSVDIVHWPVHPEAPFQYSSTAHFTLHPKENHDRPSLKHLLKQINPTAIVCSGWMDADYNALAKTYRKRIPVVLALDNWWTGSLKQRLAALAAPWLIRRLFNRAWVPGEPQIPFAQKLGFSGHALATGFYCADPNPFSDIYKKRKTVSQSKKILYIGRYHEVKGVRELWSAFMELSSDFPEWELHCIGTGELWDCRSIHPNIIHHGFKQPSALAPYIVDAACFVMPSKKEPWGVVLQEMAIAGLPLLTSQHVGAATMFLEEHENGLFLAEGNLSQHLRQVMMLSVHDRVAMSEKSHRLGLQMTPADWIHKLLTLVQ